MEIFAISDLHFDSSKEKPMDIFGENWDGHEERIKENWEKAVKDGDLVLIPGDICWATKLEDAIEDLKKIDQLPGNKIIGKGNHDYWWSTANKLNNLGLKSISFLKNNSFSFEKATIYGTRGWYRFEEYSEEDSNEKIYKRELNRLEISLKSAQNSNVSIVMLHYPPFDSKGMPNEFFHLMKEFKVDICLYGHLHGQDSHKNAREGLIDGVAVHCVSSDYMDFKLKRIL